MGLESYKLDKAFTDGVDIRLDDAPEVVFKVRLPSQYNRGYTQAMYSSIDWTMGPEGIRTTGALMTTKFAQEDAFIANCLLSMDGEPIPEGFSAEYPKAVEELMTKANVLVKELEDRVEDSVKKSPALSNGKVNGQGVKPSTQTLSATAN
jgi:hypothetical protein